MIFYIGPLIAILTSLVIIIYIVIKKLPNLAAINVESISKEKESKVRNRIMTDRLRRGALKFQRVLSEVSQPVATSLAGSWQKFYDKTLEMEKENLKKAQPLKKIDIKQDIKEKLAKAKGLMADQDFDQVEELCISVVSLDPKNLDVYELLTEIYLEDKDYKKARETCRYLLKLLLRGKFDSEGNGKKHRLANCYADLGTVYQLENRNNFALTNFKKAVQLEPSNPRFLDLLLKISIILRDKSLAVEAFNNLKKADPDNKKLPEIEEEIASIKSM